MNDIESEFQPRSLKKDKNSPSNVARNAWTYPLMATGMILLSGIVPVLGFIALIAVGFGCFYTIKTSVELVSKRQSQFLLPFIGGLVLNGMVVVANVVFIYLLFFY